MTELEFKTKYSIFLREYKVVLYEILDYTKNIEEYLGYNESFGMWFTNKFLRHNVCYSIDAEAYLKLDYPDETKRPCKNIWYDLKYRLIHDRFCTLVERWNSVKPMFEACRYNREIQQSLNNLD